MQGPIARLQAEIARLTGERDSAVANAREPIGDTWDEIRRLEGECRICIRERDEWKTVANRDLSRAEAAEAETARLREAARCVHDTFARDIAQGYRTKDKDFAVSVLSAALTSREQADA